MANFTATVYLNVTDLKTAVDAVDNTTIIHVATFVEDGKQKFVLIK